jgi:hypothetical protein
MENMNNNSNSKRGQMKQSGIVNQLFEQYREKREKVLIEDFYREVVDDLVMDVVDIDDPIGGISVNDEGSSWEFKITFLHLSRNGGQIEYLWEEVSSGDAEDGEKKLSMREAKNLREAIEKKIAEL